MQHELIDVLIVEDENELAQLHAELIGKHPRLRLVGIASSLAAAQAELESKQPQLMLLDNYLPDGKGISLINNPMLAYSILDSGRAALKTKLPLANKFVIVGQSQGGAGAVAASSYSATYAPDLNIKGSIL